MVISRLVISCVLPRGSASTAGGWLRGSDGGLSGTPSQGQRNKLNRGLQVEAGQILLDVMGRGRGGRPRFNRRRQILHGLNGALIEAGAGEIIDDGTHQTAGRGGVASLQHGRGHRESTEAGLFDKRVREETFSGSLKEFDSLLYVTFGQQERSESTLAAGGLDGATEIDEDCHGTGQVLVCVAQVAELHVAIPHVVMDASRRFQIADIGSRSEQRSLYLTS